MTGGQLQIATADDDLVHELAGDALRRNDDGSLDLIGATCGDCGTSIFPAAPVCPKCMSEKMDAMALPRSGTLYSWSTLHTGPAQWIKPYTLGYVDLPGDVRVLGRIQGALSINAQVTLGDAIVGRTAEGRPIRSFIFTSEGAAQ